MANGKTKAKAKGGAKPAAENKSDKIDRARARVLAQRVEDPNARAVFVHLIGEPPADEGGDDGE